MGIQKVVQKEVQLIRISLLTVNYPSAFWNAKLRTGQKNYRKFTDELWRSEERSIDLHPGKK